LLYIKLSNNKVFKIRKVCFRTFVNILFGLQAWQQTHHGLGKRRLRAAEFPLPISSI
jgi:hypothetical protein